MQDLYYGDQESCDCELQGPPKPKCHDCKHDIVCSQARVSECEARLFCEVTRKLSWEIKHTRCFRELERLIAMTNEFLAASAKKEAVIAKFTGHMESTD